MLDGKVAFITGAARGQGRASALRLAQESADILALDIAANPPPTLSYELAGTADLDGTVRLVEALGRQIVKGVADVRHLSEVQAVVGTGLDAFGKIDIVHANAGIGSWGHVGADRGAVERDDRRKPHRRLRHDTRRAALDG
jgi:NAD(P)-dependent dehydrogenase (short-subunit alcohol dehydrogenase family)